MLMEKLLAWSTFALAVAAWIGLVPLAVAAWIGAIRRHRRRRSREWWGNAVAYVALSVPAMTLVSAAKKDG